METITGKGEMSLLTPLFEARLQSDMEAVVSAETREGKPVGSGDGRVSGGPRSRDSALVNVRW